MKKMLEKVRHISLAVLALYSFISCQFQLEGDNFVEVDETVKTTLTRFELTELEDGLLLTEPVELSYNLAVSNGKFYYFTVVLDRRIDSQTVYESQNTSGVFVLDPDSYYGSQVYGTFDLVFTLYTNTNTNSMADIVGAEMVVYQLKKTVILDRRPPTDIPFEARLTNDCILVEFGEYPNKNLINKSVFVSYNLDELYQSENRVATLSKEDSVVNIPSYLGGKIYIGAQVETTTSDPDDLPYRTPAKSYEFAPTPGIVKTETLKNGLLKVYWSKAYFPASFGSYELTYNDNTLAETVSFDDTTAVLDNLTLAFPYEMVLKTTNQSGMSINSMETVYLGNSGPFFDRILFDEKSPNEWFIYFDSVPSLEKVASGAKFLGDRISFADVSKETGMIASFYDATITLLDYSNLSIIDEIEAWGLGNTFNASANMVSILNDQYVGYIGPNYVLVDFKNDLEYRLPQSVNAHYVEESNNLFTIEKKAGGVNNQYTISKWTIGDSEPVLETIVDEFFNYRHSYSFEDYLLIATTDSNMAYLYSLPDMELVSSYVLNQSPPIISFDPVTRWALMGSHVSVGYNLSFVNLMTGEVAHNIKSYGNQPKLKLIDGILYHGSGFSVEFDK